MWGLCAVGRQDAAACTRCHARDVCWLPLRLQLELGINLDQVLTLLGGAELYWLSENNEEIKQVRPARCRRGTRWRAQRYAPTTLTPARGPQVAPLPDEEEQHVPVRHADAQMGALLRQELATCAAELGERVGSMACRATAAA